MKKWIAVFLMVIAGGAHAAGIAPQLFAPVAFARAQMPERLNALLSKALSQIKFNASLFNLAAGSEFSVLLPNGASYTIVFEAKRDSGTGTTTWVGYLKDYGNDYRVMLTQSSDGIIGQLVTPSGLIKVETGANGSTWLVDMKTAGMQHMRPAHADTVAPPTTAKGSAPLSSNAPLDASAPPTAQAPAGNAVIDLLILYTPAEVTKYPGGQLQAKFAQFVSLANQAYIDSGVAITLRLVGTALVNYSDTQINDTALDDLTPNPTRTSQLATTAASLRDTYGADVVALIRPLYVRNNGTDSCGISWVNYQLSPDYAFSIVSEGTDMNNNGYYCSDYTLAHELGHLMGSVHDRGQYTGGSTPYAIYPYSYGYGFSTDFGTIMSYIDPEVGKFSNPALNCGKLGKPCGIPAGQPGEANNALSFNNVATTVASFRAATVPTAAANIPVLASAVIPSGSAVQMGRMAQTWGAMINSGSVTANNCRVALASAATGTTLAYRAVSGAQQNFTFTQPTNVPVSIPPGGAQVFFLTFATTVALDPTDVAFNFVCDGAAPAKIVQSLNTFILSASATPVPNIIALVGTTLDGNPNEDAMVDLYNNTGRFVVATSNIGAAGAITVSAQPFIGFSSALPSVTVCPLVPNTQTCAAPAAPSVTVTSNAGDTPAFMFFVTANGAISDSPEFNRLLIRFTDATGAVRGGTQTALRSK